MKGDAFGTVGIDVHVAILDTLSQKPNSERDVLSVPVVKEMLSKQCALCVRYGHPSGLCVRFGRALIS